MLILAQTSVEKVTALDKAKEVPVSFWVQSIGIIVGIMVLVVLLKILLPKLAQMNKILLCAVLFAVASIVGFKWIYERNEPAFLTPFVQAVAPFFPSKGSYTDKQGVDKQKAGMPPKGPVPAPTPVKGGRPVPDKPKS